ncbi:hypothetical protein BGX27_001805 [Mortierella sp. AM989]|nr:hypothetical protein BGX27_001805 [Mortierella sp. AM989]
MATQDQDTKRRRVSRACFNDSAKKRGPPKGYIEALENRLHRMENLLGGLVQNGDRVKLELDSWKEEQDDELESPDSPWASTSDTPFSSSFPQSSPVISTRNHQHTDSISTEISSQSNLEEEDEAQPYDLDAREKIHAISENLSNLSLDDGGFIRYLGNSSGIDLLQRNDMLGSGLLTMPMRMKEHRDWLFQKEATISQMESGMTMPPRDLAEHLIELYFIYVHPNMPVVHKPSFMRQYRNPDPLKRPPRVLMNAMFAIASRFSDHPEIVGSDPEGFGDEYFDRAKRLIDFEYELPRQSSIQALLLMVTYRFASAKSGGRVWVMLGMAIRMAQDLGMHRNAARWHLPPLETEVRKRLWWACYIMDRWVSAATGRPTIDDNDCDVDYPSVVEEDWAGPDGNASPSEDSERLKEESCFALRYFVESIKLAKILGQILRRVYSAQTRNFGPGQASSTVVELDSALTKWLLALPSDLRYDHRIESSQLSRWVATIHISYYSALILLHRPTMFPSSLTKSKLSESMPSLNVCVSAANSITHLGEVLMREDCLKFIWSFTTYDVLQSSLIHLTNSASIDVRLQAQARKNLIKTIAYMKSLGERWFNAAKFALVLEDLMCAHLNFDEYKADGRILEPVIAAQASTPDSIYPIILRDQSHPSGGSLLFSPKIISGSHTPSSSISTPSSSPSTQSIQNPELQDIKQEPNGPDHSILQNISDHSHGGDNSNAANHPFAKPKRHRKTNSQWNSVLSQTNSSSNSLLSLGASSGSLNEQPIFTFSSLSTPGMFIQGQAFMDYKQPSPQLQQQHIPHQQQQQQQQYQQQQAPQQSQPVQPFSVTPLFSSLSALQERSTQQQQQQQQANGTQKQSIEPIQQQLEQHQSILLQQNDIQRQQQFIQQHQLNMQLQNQQRQTQQEQQQQFNSQYSNLHNSVGNNVSNLNQDCNSRGSMTPTSNAPGSEDYSSLPLFPSQELVQDPNLIAVPNPFFGIPNTIDWDEWNQYIANAGLQKF